MIVIIACTWCRWETGAGKVCQVRFGPARGSICAVVITSWARIKGQSMMRSFYYFMWLKFSCLLVGVISQHFRRAARAAGRPQMARRHPKRPPPSVPQSRNVYRVQRSWVWNQLLHLKICFNHLFIIIGTWFSIYNSQVELFRVLKAYSILNPVDGYFQGQAPVAAMVY